jgi:erythromycin esterase-like protein
MMVSEKSNLLKSTIKELQKMHAMDFVERISATMGQNLRILPIADWLTSKNAQRSLLTPAT